MYGYRAILHFLLDHFQNFLGKSSIQSLDFPQLLREALLQIVGLQLSSLANHAHEYRLN